MGTFQPNEISRWYCKRWQILDFARKWTFCSPIKKKKEEKKVERYAKMQLWKSLAELLSQKCWRSMLQNRNQIMSWLIKANFFGKVVADTLLQYEIKEWVYLKKKIMNVFFDYDQQKQVVYAPTFTGAGPSRNSSSSSSLVPQEANSLGQNCYLNMLLANRFQCNQQASSTVNQMFQRFSPASIESQDTLIIQTRKGLWFYFHFCCVKKNICVYIYVYVYIISTCIQKSIMFILFHKYMFNCLNINSCAFPLPWNTTRKVICKFFLDTFCFVSRIMSSCVR